MGQVKHREFGEHPPVGQYRAEPRYSSGEGVENMHYAPKERDEDMFRTACIKMKMQTVAEMTTGF